MSDKSSHIRLLVTGPPGSLKDKSVENAIKMLASAGYHVKSFSFGDALVEDARKLRMGSPYRLGEAIQSAMHHGYQNDFFRDGLDTHFSSGGMPINGIVTSSLNVLNENSNKIGGLPLKILDYLGITPDSIINIVPNPTKVEERVKGRHPSSMSGIEDAIRREYESACNFRDHLGDSRIISIPEDQAAETIAKRIINGSERYFDLFYLGYPISQCKDPKLIKRIYDFHESLYPYTGRLIPIRMADKPDSKVNGDFIVWLDTEGPFINGSNAHLLMYYPDSGIRSDGCAFEINCALSLGRDVYLIKPDAGEYAFSDGRNPRIRVYKDAEDFNKKMELFKKDPENPEYAHFGIFFKEDYKTPRYNELKKAA